MLVAQHLTKQDKDVLCLLDKHIVPRRTLCHCLPEAPSAVCGIIHAVLPSTPTSWQLLQSLSKAHTHFMQSITFLKGVRLLLQASMS